MLANYRKYYTMDSVDNLSDHIPLFIMLDCVVNTVPVGEAVKVNNRSPVWRLASSCNIEQYQLELDSKLQSSYPKAEMFLDNSGNNLCLKMEYVSNFHDMIMQAANNAMDKHIPHTSDRKPMSYLVGMLKWIAHDNHHYFGIISRMTLAVKGQE